MKKTKLPKAKEEQQEMNFPISHDYFYTSSSNPAGTDDLDSYSDDHYCCEYKSIYPFINADIEAVAKSYPANTDIGAEARALSFQVNTGRFIHILMDSVASLYFSIKNTIEYFWSVEYNNALDKLNPYIMSELYNAVAIVIKSLDYTEMDVKATITLAVDKFVSELYNDIHASIFKLCLNNLMSDQVKADALGCIYPIFVSYRDSLIDSILRYILETAGLNAYYDHIKCNKLEDKDDE